MTLMLLDSGSLWYRAYYGMPDTLVAPDGTPVNAIRGFLDMSARLISIYNPDRLVICLDGDWRPSWRVDLIPEYKANRLEDEDSEEEAEPESNRATDEAKEEGTSVEIYTLLTDS